MTDANRPPEPPPHPGGGFALPPGANRPGHQHEPGYLQPGYTAAPGWGRQQYADTDDPMISPNYAGWWRRSMAALRRSWAYLLGMHGAVVALAVALEVVLSVRSIPIVNNLLAELRQVTDERPIAPGTWADFAAGLGDLLVIAVPGGLVVAVAATIVQLAVVRVVVDGASGGPVRLGAALRLGARRFFPLIGWGLLAVPLVLLGACCFLLPGVYMGAVLGTVLVPVVALERGRGIGRAFSLAHKDLGTGLSRIATVTGLSFLVGVASWGISATLGGLGGGADDPVALPGQIVALVITGVIGLAVQVLTSPLRVLAYADMRSRVEPLSAQMLRDA